LKELLIDDGIVILWKSKKGCQALFFVRVENGMRAQFKGAF